MSAKRSQRRWGGKGKASGTRGRAGGRSGRGSGRGIESLEPRNLLAATITVNSTADTVVADSVLTLREAIKVSNGELHLTDLSAQEQALVSGSPTGGTNTISFNFGNSDA